MRAEEREDEWSEFAFAVTLGGQNFSEFLTV